MDLLELLACLGLRVQKELLELTGQTVKRDHQGQMVLLERGALQDCRVPPGYQDNGVHREHKEKGVTVVLLATWEKRDLQVFKDLQDPLDHEEKGAKVDLEVPKVPLVLVEGLETRDPLEMWVQLEFQVSRGPRVGLETWDHTEPRAHVGNEDHLVPQVLLVHQGCLENQDLLVFKVHRDLWAVEASKAPRATMGWLGFKAYQDL